MGVHSKAFSALAAAAIGAAVFGNVRQAQAAVVFSDNFNRATLTGAGSPTTYTTVVTAGDGGAAINTTGSSFLELTNDATAAANANGRVYTRFPTSDYAAGYNAVLSSNTNVVTWTFNLRSTRTTDPSGFGSGSYGTAVVLGASADDFTTANGYAVTYGQSGGPDPIRLVRFSGGLLLDSSLTQIGTVSGGTLANANDFASVKVTYDPSNNNWSLFVRDDGTTAWGDPTTTATQVVSATADSTFTGTSLARAGYFWNYSTAATQTDQFDNFTVAVPEPGSALLAMSAAGLLMLRRRRA